MAKVADQYKGDKKVPQKTCMCPSCGYEFINTAGTMCSAQKCPVCNAMLRAK